MTVPDLERSGSQGVARKVTWGQLGQLLTKAGPACASVYPEPHWGWRAGSTSKAGLGLAWTLRATPSLPAPASFLGQGVVGEKW